MAKGTKPDLKVVSAQTAENTTSESGLMSFGEHLAELRGRLLASLLWVMVFTGTAFAFAPRLIEMLQWLVPVGTQFVQLSPGEVFIASFRLAVFVGLGLSLPVLLYHLFRFITPGLKPTEQRWLLPMLVLSLGLFALGVVFGYRVILPLMLGFLLDYGQEVALNQLSIAQFLNFCTGFLFASGLMFQLPVFLLLSSLIGLVSSQKLLVNWKWAILASFLLGALITPSADPFSQIVMAGSLALLYGFSVGLIRLFGR